MGNSTEKQDGKTLHGHTNIWIENFNTLQSLLYHKNDTVKENSISKLVQGVYQKSHVCLYGDLEITHSCDAVSEPILKTSTNMFEPPANQLLHDMRHADHALLCC